MSETIILNRICTGEYLDEGSNLGHEVVNLFKADNGQYFVYLMPEGTYPVSRKNNKVEAVYFTKGNNKRCVEVIAAAIGIETVFEPCEGGKCLSLSELDKIGDELSNIEKLSELKAMLKSLNKEKLYAWLDTKVFLQKKLSEDFKKEDLKAKAEQLYDFAKIIKDNHNLRTAICRRAEHINQLWYIIENDVRYGGVLVNELFKYNSTEKYGMSIYLTFKADRIVKPKNPMYLFVGDVSDESGDLSSVPYASYIELCGRKRLSTTALASFIEQKNETANYKLLLGKINDINLWGEKLDYYKPINAESDDFTFLTIIKKEYDELVFSNMFQYFFMHKSYRHLFIELLKEKSGVTLSDSYTVKREEANIDLLVIDNKEKSVVVIENKVRSGLNGLVYDENNKIIGTQLGKYKKYVEKEYPDMKHNFYVFKPNYSIITEKELEGYTAVTYEEIAEKLEEGVKKHTTTATDVYFSDFVKALKIHSSKDDKRYEETMRRRLQSVIDSQKNN